MNKVYLIGNLTRDPELSNTTSGVAVCRLSIAVGRRFANADGSRDTDFFNVTAWRATAENCARYLKKGSKIADVGSIQTRNHERSDGTKGVAIDVVADEVEFLSTKNDGSSESSVTANSSAPVSDLQPVDDDSLPF